MNIKTIRQIQDEMKKGIITSRQLCIDLFQRIAEYDSCEGGLNSVAEINPDALAIATEMDKERSFGNIRGPMHGIPVMLKANINTADKMHTTAGSMALKDNFAPYDAKIVENLRASGVVILGKTNLTEFANFMTKNMRNGYSSLGGEVLCPYDRNADPCGSSTGSAVSVAVGLCPAAIGTETSGSIICPSWTNGIVGIKPTRELIPGEGIIPISGTLDTAGPMARSVADAAALLGAMTGKGDSFSKGLGSATLKGKRIGLNKFNLGDIGTDKAAVYEKITGIMEASGAELVELPGMDHNVNLKYFLYYEFKNNMNHYLSTLNSGFGIKTMDDIIDFNKANKKKALKYGQFYLLQAKYFSSGRCMEADYLKALKAREDQIKELESLFRENDLDSILHANIYNNLAAFTGCPSITIPTGLDSKGMPMGMQMISWKFNDRTLIETAYALEKALDIQLVPPGF